MKTSFTLAAALVATLAAPAAFAGAADAISLKTQQQVYSNVLLDTVSSATNGTLAIVDYHGGVAGATLGSVPVTAGTTTDVKVSVGRIVNNGDVIAVLYNEFGDIVASKKVDVER